MPEEPQDQLVYWRVIITVSLDDDTTPRMCASPSTTTLRLVCAQVPRRCAHHGQLPVHQARQDRVVGDRGYQRWSSRCGAQPSVGHPGEGEHSSMVRERFSRRAERTRLTRDIVPGSPPRRQGGVHRTLTEHDHPHGRQARPQVRAVDLDALLRAADEAPPPARATPEASAARCRSQPRRGRRREQPIRRRRAGPLDAAASQPRAEWFRAVGQPCSRHTAEPPRGIPSRTSPHRKSAGHHRPRCETSHLFDNRYRSRSTSLPRCPTRCR